MKYKTITLYKIKGKNYYILECDKIVKAQELWSYEYLKHKGFYLAPNGYVFELVQDGNKERLVYCFNNRVYYATYEDIVIQEENLLL